MEEKRSMAMVSHTLHISQEVSGDHFDTVEWVWATTFRCSANEQGDVANF
jgi:hypothetical protein